MNRRLLIFGAALLFAALTASNTFAQGGGGGGGGGGGNGGGGGGGGGGNKSTIRWTGIITQIQPTADGYLVTLGTSYYAVGTGIVNSSTKIKLNGSSSDVTGADLRVGDSAQMNVLWPSRQVVKMEVTGTR